MIRYACLLVVGTVLPFVLAVLGSYIVLAHTTVGRQSIYILLHSQQMTDQQLAHAIGRNPFAVLHWAGLLECAIDPILALLVGAYVACFERRIPGRITALVLAPYFLWNFRSLAFATVRPPAETALKIAKVLGTNAAYIMVAAFAAFAIARLLGNGPNARQS